MKKGEKRDTFQKQLDLKKRKKGQGDIALVLFGA